MAGYFSTASGNLADDIVMQYLNEHTRENSCSLAS